MYSPEEAAKRAELFNEARKTWENVKDYYTRGKYPGTAPVPYSPYTTKGQEEVLAALPGAKDTLAKYQDSINFSLRDVLYPESNPALRATIDAAVRPITESYTDAGGVMSQIRTNALGNNQFGGSRQGIAEGIAAGRYADAVGDVSSAIANKGYLAGLNTMEKAMGLTPQAVNAQLVPATWYSGLGLQDETMTQAMNDYLTAQKLWDMSAQWTPLQNYASIVMGLGPSQSSATSTGPTPASASPFTQLLGTGMMAYPYLNSMGLFSPAASMAAVPAATTAAAVAGDAIGLDWLGSLLFV
jgi:hypothetical protein